MARFYDTVSDSNLRWVEELLTRGGIEYSLRILDDKVSLKEIEVAEEDLSFAESLLSGSSALKK